MVKKTIPNGFLYEKYNYQLGFGIAKRIHRRDILHKYLLYFKGETRVEWGGIEPPGSRY